jgi:NodT family efflux transporter outer membrane factor (OMF) lipoprotein
VRRALLLVLALASCTVGPDYAGPPNVAPNAARSSAFRRVGLTPVAPTPPVARWWTELDDPMLGTLIETALSNGTTVRAAQARLRRARAVVSENRAGLFPQGSASGLALHSRLPTGGLLGRQGGSSSATKLDLYNVGFDATWELDLFGGTRRGIEGARARAEAEEAALADAQVQPAAEVTQAYVSLRATQRREELYGQTAEIEQGVLRLMAQRRSLGSASQTDVERLTTQLNQTLADATQVRAEADLYLDQIATLVGLEPGQLDEQLARPAPIPLPPATVPVGDPAALLRRRPDIRQAERQLAASNAQIGQAVAQYFPSVSLLGAIGFAGTDASRLFSSSSLAYLGGPSISWNFLGFGRTGARVDQAKAGRDEAIEQYRQVVLGALRDAETSLSRFGHQRENLLRLSSAEAAAGRAAALTRERQQAGTASLADVLDTERQRVQTEQGVVQARAALTNSFIALQKALGLGWDAPGVPGL